MQQPAKQFWQAVLGAADHAQLGDGTSALHYHTSRRVRWTSLQDIVMPQELAGMYQRTGPTAVRLYYSTVTGSSLNFDFGVTGDYSISGSINPLTNELGKDSLIIFDRKHVDQTLQEDPGHPLGLMLYRLSPPAFRRLLDTLMAGHPVYASASPTLDLASAFVLATDLQCELAEASVHASDTAFQNFWITPPVVGAVFKAEIVNRYFRQPRPAQIKLTLDRHFDGTAGHPPGHISQQLTIAMEPGGTICQLSRNNQFRFEGHTSTPLSAVPGWLQYYLYPDAQVSSRDLDYFGQFLTRKLNPTDLAI